MGDNFAEAVKLALSRQRADHAAEVSELRRDIETLRGRLDTQRTLDSIAERLAKLETSRGAGLRAV